jgi:ankyrin repeat protein
MFSPRPAQDGATPLHLAAASGHADAASLLLAKSDVDAEDGSGNTPAWAAFAAKQGAVARMLISIGDGDVNAACTEGKSYLHGAAERGALEDAAWLLENGAAVDAKDMRCDTPLHLAAAAGAWDVGRRLVDAGASVNARGKARARLHVPDALRALPTPHLLTAALTASSVMQDARTPLHVAACNPSHARGRCSFVELLLQKGADPCALNKVRMGTHSALRRIGM